MIGVSRHGEKIRGWMDGRICGHRHGSGSGCQQWLEEDTFKWSRDAYRLCELFWVSNMMHLVLLYKVHTLCTPLDKD